MLMLIAAAMLCCGCADHHAPAFSPHHVVLRLPHALRSAADARCLLPRNCHGWERCSRINDGWRSGEEVARGKNAGLGVRKNAGLGRAGCMRLMRVRGVGEVSQGDSGGW